ncbi:MAG: hypothetical protein R3266_03715, partial [Gemmatimonadota bacterium]|nr:hypothetical protein [Gemmatimonadota bacterium]
MRERTPEAPFPISGPSASRPTPRWRLALLASVALVAGCKEPIRDPLGITPRLAPFERLPYLQAVDTASATVLWLASTNASDSLEIRVGSAVPWQAVPVERHDERPSPFGGTVATRSAHLTGLPADADVAYRAWAGSRAVGPFTFRTAPRPSANDTVRVLAFGDSGWGSEAQVNL